MAHSPGSKTEIRWHSGFYLISNFHILALRKVVANDQIHLSSVTCMIMNFRDSSQDLGPGIIENWLLNIRDVRRLHQKELEGCGDHEGRHRRLVELHVREQALNILKTGIVQRSRRASLKVRTRTANGVVVYSLAVCVSVCILFSELLFDVRAKH